MAQNADQVGQAQSDNAVEEAKEADLIANRDRKKETARTRSWQAALLSILMFLSAAWALPLVFFTEVQREYTLLYTLYLAVSAGIGVLASIATWMLRRWGLIAYAAIATLNVIVTLVTGDFHVLLVIIPAVILAFGFTQRDNLTRAGS